MTTRQLEPLHGTLYRAVQRGEEGAVKTEEGSTVYSGEGSVTVHKSGERSCSCCSRRAVPEESCDGGSSLCSRAQGWEGGEERDQRPSGEELAEIGGKRSRSWSR